MKERAIVVTVVLTMSAMLAVPAHANRTEPLAQGPVAALPPGDSFLSIIALPQPAGASLAHGHIPGFVYGLDGKATIVDEDSAMETAVSPGEGHFIAALAVHTHKNADDRFAAGALALALVAGVIALLLVVRSPRTRVAAVPVLLAALIAGGAVALWNPWGNDWYFIGIRPESARGGPMPTPSASRTYESPAFSNVPPGPYVESLARTTVDPQSQAAEPNVPGPVVLFVLDGQADVTSGNNASIRLGHHEATLVQAGESVRVVNPGGKKLKLLRFALTPEQSAS